MPLLKGLKSADIFKEMKNVLDDSALSYTTVKNCVAEFKRGRTNIQDNHRSECPRSVTTPEMVVKIYDMVLKDRRLKFSKRCNAVSVSKQWEFKVLHNKLGMKKLFV